jgi:hypothetical protein
MDLKDFITQTLTQIASGVKDAQSSARAVGAVVNPHITTEPAEASRHGFLFANGSYSPIVQFDVALTVTEGTGTKGGIGVFSGAINLGSSGQSQNEQSTVSRVKFSVPIALPYYGEG